MLPILLMIDEITQEDERELLRRLFFTYAPKMKLLAQSILKNEADAEDALHDTFLLVIRYRKKFVQADEIEIKRLLVIYSKSVCFNRLRREKRTRARIVPDTAPDADDGLHPAADIPDADADPGETLLTKEQADVLRRAIDRLPSPRGDRLAAVLCRAHQRRDRRTARHQALHGGQHPAPQPCENSE